MIHMILCDISLICKGCQQGFAQLPCPRPEDCQTHALARLLSKGSLFGFDSLEFRVFSFRV